MAKTMNAELVDFYEFVRERGKLLSNYHAQKWSDGVLRTLGTALSGRSKRALARALPAELARELKGVFWLLHFRDASLTGLAFRNMVARRSGNSDSEFALHPTLAVFAGLHRFIDKDLDRRIVRDLPPEIGELWSTASTSTASD